MSAVWNCLCFFVFFLILKKKLQNFIGKKQTVASTASRLLQDHSSCREISWWWSLITREFTRQRMNRGGGAFAPLLFFFCCSLPLLSLLNILDFPSVWPLEPIWGRYGRRKSVRTGADYGTIPWSHLPFHVTRQTHAGCLASLRSNQISWRILKSGYYVRMEGRKEQESLLLCKLSHVT